jgi:DNA-binding transcriptional LysR family regulator
MNLSLLMTFLTVAETGSFTRAARETFVTQPAISHHIKALEEDLGVRLFIRRGQRIQLTPEGEELRRHTRAIMKTIEGAEFSLKEMSELRRGRLRIAATAYMAYLLPPALVALKRRHPNVQTDVRIRNSAEVIRMVDEGGVDLGFAGRMTNVPVDLGITPVHTERLILTTSSEHPLAGRRRITPGDLRGHMLAIREPGTHTRRRIMEWFGDEPLPDNIIEIDETEIALQLALAGCVTFVPERTVASDVMAGRLVKLPTRGLASDMEYALYLASGIIPSMAAHIFLEILSGLPTLSNGAALKSLL